MSRRHALTLGAALLWVLLGPVVAWAQGPGAASPSMSRQEMLRSLQGQYEERLSRELNLDAEQRAFLREVFREFGEARAELLPRRLEVMRQVNRLVGGSVSEERAAVLLQELRELREAESRLLAAEEERLLETLSASQVLRLQVLRDQFGDRIRILRARDGTGPFGPRGGGGPGPAPPGSPRR
jgi:Spy/CpxP family protein refolding chaperone